MRAVSYSTTAAGPDRNLVYRMALDPLLARLRLSLLYFEFSQGLLPTYRTLSESLRTGVIIATRICAPTTTLRPLSRPLLARRFRL